MASIGIGIGIEIPIFQVLVLELVLNFGSCQVLVLNFGPFQVLVLVLVLKNWYCPCLLSGTRPPICILSLPEIMQFKACDILQCRLCIGSNLVRINVCMLLRRCKSSSCINLFT